MKIRCVLTPGHTDGVLSLFFDVTHNGETYLAGLLGGAGVNALTLPYIYYNERTEDPTQQMLRSIEKIWNEPVVVHLGNHPGNNKTLQKREQQLKEGGNPFIAPDSWHTFLTELRKKVENYMYIVNKDDEIETSIFKVSKSGNYKCEIGAYESDFPLTIRNYLPGDKIRLKAE